MLWDYLSMTRIYTKREGNQPDLAEPVVLSAIRKGTTVKALCQNVSTQMLRDFNFAMVWGKSAKHSPQRCGVNHQLEDEDVVQIVTKTNSQMRQNKNYGAMVQGFSDKVTCEIFLCYCVGDGSLNFLPLFRIYNSITRRSLMPKRKSKANFVGDWQ